MYLSSQMIAKIIYTGGEKMNLDLQKIIGLVLALFTLIGSLVGMGIKIGQVNTQLKNFHEDIQELNEEIRELNKVSLKTFTTSAKNEVKLDLLLEQPAAFQTANK